MVRLSFLVLRCIVSFPVGGFVTFEKVQSFLCVGIGQPCGRVGKVNVREGFRMHEFLAG